MSLKLNHYSVLKLNPTGLNEADLPYSEKEIKKAYKARALKVHPDHNREIDAAILC